MSSTTSTPPDHPRAGRLAHLDRRDADAGGGAVHHQGLAGLQGPVLEDIGVDREHRLRQAGGLDEVEVAGDRQGVAGVADRELGVAAAAQQGADAVALAPAPGGHGDGPGHLQAHRRGRAGRRRVEAQALDDVGPVDAGGPDLDQDLALARRRRGDARGAQRRGRALAPLDLDGGHPGVDHGAFLW
jgi:hypothetical protein